MMLGWARRRILEQVPVPTSRRTWSHRQPVDVLDQIAFSLHEATAAARELAAEKEQLRSVREKSP
jgi:hypothetical protein